MPGLEARRSRRCHASPALPRAEGKRDRGRGTGMMRSAARRLRPTLRPRGGEAAPPPWTAEAAFGLSGPRRQSEGSDGQSRSTTRTSTPYTLHLTTRNLHLAPRNASGSSPGGAGRRPCGRSCSIRPNAARSRDGAGRNSVRPPRQGGSGARGSGRTEGMTGAPRPIGQRPSGRDLDALIRVCA